MPAKVVLSNADPFRMRGTGRRGTVPERFNAKLDGFRRTGTTMKVNLALDRLPTFTCLPENRGQHNAHHPPAARRRSDVIGHMRRGFEKVQAGELAEFPTIEWYIHTQADPTLRDDSGRHNSAFFVQWVPYELSGGKQWEDEESRYVDHLLEHRRAFAPGFYEHRRRHFPLTPKKIESTSASPTATSTTSTTPSASTGGCPTRRRSRGSTPAAPAATPPARSSARRATTRPCEDASLIWIL